MDAYTWYSKHVLGDMHYITMEQAIQEAKRLLARVSDFSTKWAITRLINKLVSGEISIQEFMENLEKIESRMM